MGQSPAMLLLLLIVLLILSIGGGGWGYSRYGAVGLSPAAVVLLVVDDAADRELVTRTASSLVAASAPEIPAPTVQVVVGAHRPDLVSVGPFQVDRRSASGLRIALAVALALIAGLASWIAIGARRAHDGR